MFTYLFPSNFSLYLRFHENSVTRESNLVILNWENSQKFPKTVVPDIRKAPLITLSPRDGTCSALLRRRVLAPWKKQWISELVSHFLQEIPTKLSSSYQETVVECFRSEKFVNSWLHSFMTDIGLVKTFACQKDGITFSSRNLF